jgi:hypothetical protein
LPSLNLNKKLPKDWSVNFKAESGHRLSNGNFNSKIDFDYDYLLTDLSLIFAKKIGINASVAGGYLIRINNENISNRAIQQISFIKRYPAFRLSHRISADQTFRAESNTEFRFRYRLSSEIPLEGQTLDPKEFFIKTNNEYLNSFHGETYDLEVRIAGFLGYAFSPKSKFEFGLDYRIDSFIENNTRNRIWLGLNFYQSL